MTAPSSGSRRPNAARERSRVQNLRDGIEMIYWNLRNANPSFEMARANMDRFAIEKSSRFSSWFNYCGNSCRIAYFIVQLSNLCSRHCRPSRPAPNSPNWTSSSWRAPTSPISADWSRSTTTAATSSNRSRSSQRISIPTTAPLSTPSRYYIRLHKEIASRSVEGLEHSAECNVMSFQMPYGSHLRNGQWGLDSTPDWIIPVRIGHSDQTKVYRHHHSGGKTQRVANLTTRRRQCALEYNAPKIKSESFHSIVFWMIR